VTPQRISRRSALGIGLGAVAAAAGATALAVERSNAVAYGSAGSPAHFAPTATPTAYPSPPTTTAGPLVLGSFASKGMSPAPAHAVPVDFEISYPPGSKPGDPLPVAVLLHGLDESEATAFDSDMAFNLYQAQAVAHGVPPFAIATVYGADEWWHPRADRTDAAALVVDEFLPLLAGRGLRAGAGDKVALMGWSMGGYGALHLGGLLGPARVAAVAAMSPAIWPSYLETTVGAFDGQADFDRNGVFGRQASLADIPVRIDCGLQDGLCAFAKVYVEGFAHRPAGGWQPGEHLPGYWRSVAPAHMDFVGRALAAGA